MRNPYLNNFSGVRMSLDDVLGMGSALIQSAVEAVIAKHERELQEIAIMVKAERDSALSGFGMTGSCSNSIHSGRMAALNGSHDRYLDQLLMAQNRAMGVNNMAGPQGIGAGQMGVGGFL